MTWNGWLQIAVFAAIVLALVKPVGLYMTKVFNGERTWLSPVLRPVERLFYGLSGVRENEDQHWLAYAFGMLLFNAAGFFLLYAILRLQAYLPWNPQGLGNVPADLAFNTAISFTTNTNWQNYGGESTLSYFSQMAGLTVHNFVSAATGIALAVALIRGFARKIAGIGNMDDLLWAVAHQIALMLKAHVVLLLPENGDLTVRVGYPPEDELDEADLAAAKWSWSRGQVAGRSSDTLPGAKRLFLPLRTERGLVGVMGLDRPNESTLLSPDERRLLDALADQAAVAIERIALAAGIDEARVSGETERLRAALLTSISHDLKTPLASIIGSITSLRKFWPTFEAQTRDELLGTVQDEAERLTRFVGNVLDMTRLEAKSVTPQLFPADVAEMLGIVAGDVRRALPTLRLSVEAPAGLQPALMDAHLFRQVMFNLLDNAAKYAPADSAVRIVARTTAQGIAIEVMDEGPGIPPGDLERIFDKFFRIQVGDRRRAGTGLGLSICKGFVEAMGGTIVAENRTDGPPGRSGALFRVTLKAAPQEPVPDEP